MRIRLELLALAVFAISAPSFAADENAASSAKPAKTEAGAVQANAAALPVDTLPEDVKSVPRAERIDPIVAPVKRVQPKTPTEAQLKPKTLKAGVTEGTEKAKPENKTAAQKPSKGKKTEID
jgi:hypothetical protein